jgi:hypothetical protein
MQAEERKIELFAEFDNISDEDCEEDEDGLSQIVQRFSPYLYCDE